MKKELIDMDLNQKIDLGWNFDNSYIFLPKKFYTRWNPVPVNSPELVVLNETLAGELGLNPLELQSNTGVDILAGNAIAEGSIPIAQAYAGHQFGHFAMLGDGRAILLGEQINPQGERYDIQLKGSGKTPYSRGGDGRAVLGPMLREYIISEALFKLGIPSTRSLSVTKTGENVIRERILPGAILTRVSKSHIRVGTFQYISKYGNLEELRLLAEYTLQRHYPEIASKEDRFSLLIRKVIKKQAELIAKWQLVGFIHGVMNTDNMAISGESIDFGPCAFMDTYKSTRVFSSIDIHGRYSYGNQPKIASWNLARFAETLLPLIDDNRDLAMEIANQELSSFATLYHGLWIKGMRSKLGLFNESPEDESLIMELLSIMEKNQADYTNTFIYLTTGGFIDLDFINTDDFNQWKNKWEKRRDRQVNSKSEQKQLMMDNNPSVIPRNHKVEEALEAATMNNDYTVLHNLLNALAEPYGYLEKYSEYSKAPQPSGRVYKTYCGT